MISPVAEMAMMRVWGRGYRGVRRDGWKNPPDKSLHFSARLSLVEDNKLPIDDRESLARAAPFLWFV